MDELTLQKNEMNIAIIPVGYADGFRRSLGNGKGSIFINGQVFYTVGNVCMDMVIVDISNENIRPGDFVEIIGEDEPYQLDPETIYFVTNLSVINLVIY